MVVPRRNLFRDGDNRLPTGYNSSKVNMPNDSILVSLHGTSLGKKREGAKQN